jgi:hypothetical protein
VSTESPICFRSKYEKAVSALINNKTLFLEKTFKWESFLHVLKIGMK